MRGSYWQKSSHVPEFYRGIIADTEPQVTNGIVKWRVKFDDGIFTVEEKELTRSISELINKRQQQVATIESVEEKSKPSIKHTRKRQRYKL